MAKRSTGMVPKCIKFQPDDWAEVERQAIKVFGEHNHASALVRRYVTEGIQRFLKREKGRTK